MNRSLLRQLLLYRYRYSIGIVLFVVLLILMVFVRLDLAPSGVSQSEMSSSVTSATLQLAQPFSQPWIDAPYHVLQKLSLSVLGLNQWGITLPSLLLGLATGVAFLMMVRRWFRMNVALITSFIFVTSAAFLVQARTGTPMIMTTFWLSIILLAVTNILHPEGRSKLWGIVLLIVVPLSLYTPLMIYPLLSVGIAGLLHPHVRFVARRMAAWKYVAVGLTVVALLTPLAFTIIKYPETLPELAGIPTHTLSLQDIVFNTKVVTKSFLSIGSAVVGSIPQPIFGAASLIIIVLGLFRTIADHHSARSYMLLIWSASFIPIALLNPDKLLICLIPAYLFMAIGVETLIREWYKLFPLNPYARLAGLLPLIVLLGGIMVSNTAQYFYGYFYGNPNVPYKLQLAATNRILAAQKDKKAPVSVVVVSDESAFYDLLRRKHGNVTVAVSAPVKPAGVTIIHDGATYSPEALGVPYRIVTSYRAQSDQVIVRQYQ
jgi:4-amino-4-deoxy-L-arabinose transferase-like glycosyltransferase